MHNALPMPVHMNYACACALHNNATSKTMIMTIINGQYHYHGPYPILRISYREFLLTDPPKNVTKLIKMFFCSQKKTPKPQPKNLAWGSFFGNSKFGPVASFVGP